MVASACKAIEGLLAIHEFTVTRDAESTQRQSPSTPAWEQRKLGELYSLVSEKNDLTFGRESIISVANMYFNATVNVTDEQYLRTYNVMRLGDIAFEGNRSKKFVHGRRRGIRRISPGSLARRSRCQ